MGNKFKFFLTILFIGLQIIGHAQSYKIKEGVKRIVFIGNSITYAGGYINYVNAYLSIRFPQKNYEIINLGLPSETVSGLSEPNHANGAFPRPNLHDRLKRLLAMTKPDLVFACYGMNDGIYMPLEEGRFKKFRQGISRLHTEVVNQGAEIIHLTPPIYDGHQGKTYSDVLEVYSDWLLRQRHSSGWKVIDIHHPMKQELKMQRLKDPNFAFAKDGIHPNRAGHFIMAKAILLSLGAEELKQAKDIKEVLHQYKNGAEILSRIQTLQGVTKDAWLTYVGHQRPKMKLGVSMEQAIKISKDLKIKIQALVNE
ncbi:MAG: SGNH/GDSL hydrolase family protein [Flavobacteriaceae bacterium]|nr:SGNH/GDSL hydrolase family protein [Flavobacteriaceae bacterium]